MGAAAKYLIRQASAVTEAEPERMTEQDALRLMVSATGGIACSFHEVGPIANHLCGPVAAVPPEGHPDHASLRSSGGSQRSPRAVDILIMDACGLSGPNAVRCTCDGESHHPFLVTMRHLSQGQVARAHVNNTETQANMEAAFRSGDVDRLTWIMDPRVEALKMLADRARAEHGGDLPEVVAEAVVVIARTMLGPTRWDVRTGHGMYDWPIGFRVGVAFETAESVMRQEFVHDRVIQRLVEGS